ncbi:MAG: hypothetical protein RLZZ127_3047 [Planctomycetota bacterium]|jgi:hypothetical protein
MRPLLTILAAAPLLGVDVEPAKLTVADAAILDPGRWELELGATWRRSADTFDDTGSREDRDGVRRELAASLGVSYGLAADLDASLEVGYARIRDKTLTPSSGNGITDAELGLRWRFWSGGDAAAAAALALIPTIGIPLGSDDSDDLPTASTVWTPGLMLAASGHHGLWSGNADLGWSQPIGSEEDRGGVVGTVVADVAVGYVVEAGVQPELGISWSMDEVESGDAPWSLAVSAGAQVAMEQGRFAVGLQQVVAGTLTDAATVILLDVVIPLP